MEIFNIFSVIDPFKTGASGSGLGVPYTIQYNMSVMGTELDGTRYIRNYGKGGNSFNAEAFASNHIYLNGTTQSVPYPVLHTLGSEIQLRVDDILATSDEIISYTKNTDTSFDLAVTTVGTSNVYPFMNNPNNGNIPADGSVCVLSFDAVVNSGTPIITNAYINNSNVVNYEIVSGYNELILDVGSATAGTWIYWDGTNLFNISVTNWTVKEITLPTASYLTYFDSTTNTLIELSSTGDVGENLVSNGDFSDGLNGWTDSNNWWSAVSGRAYHPSTDLYKPLESTSFDPKSRITFGFDIEFVSATKNVKAILRYGASSINKIVTADGSYSYTVTEPIDKIDFSRNSGENEFYLDNVFAKEMLPISTTYSVTDSHQFVFNHTSPLSAEDKLAIEQDPNLALRMFLDGEVLPSGFSNTDVGWFSVGNEGLASAEKVYDLSDQAFLTYVSIVGYDAATRTTLANQSNGASNLKLTRNVSGGTTGTAAANTTQWEADGRTAVTNWTILAPYTITEIIGADTYTFTSDLNRYKNSIADGTFIAPTGIWTLDEFGFDGVTLVTVRGVTKTIDEVVIP